MRGTRIKIALLVVVLLMAVVARPESSRSGRSNPSRLGLKGKIGYLVTSVDASTSQPEIKVGDIVVASSASGQITSVEQFQASVKALTPGQTLLAEVLRFDPSTGLFKEVDLTLKTFAFLSGQQSRLGLMGLPGFFVAEIDPAVTQPGIKVGDFITETNLAGQIIDFDQFRTTIMQATVGSIIQATFLRYNPATGEFNEITTTLTVFPFPNPSRHHSPQADCTGNGCGRDPCLYCCDCCTTGAACKKSQCETGKTACRPNPPLGCLFTLRT